MEGVPPLEPRTAFVWPATILSEARSIYQSGIQSVSADTEEDYSPRQVSEQLGALLSRGFTKSQRTLLEDSVRRSFSKGLQFSELVMLIEPFLKCSTDFGSLNIHPQFPIGVACINQQLQWGLMKRGCDFNLMVVGRSGTGKSTLLDTIYLSSISSNHHDISINDLHAVPSTSSIRCIRHVLEEDGYRIRLGLIDTPGFGDYADNDGAWNPVLSYIKARLDAHLRREQRSIRDPFYVDDRVHCCLYFIPPVGHRLSEIDITTLKWLSGHVNLVPLIARADSLLPEELAAFKKRIADDLQHHNILTYNRSLTHLSERFPDSITGWLSIDVDEPLAVIGANSATRSDRPPYISLLRKTPFGDIDIMDSNICDFPALLDLLVRKSMWNLIEITDKIHYEEYRAIALRPR